MDQEQVAHIMQDYEHGDAVARSDGIMPIIISKLNIDPAVASGPFITTML